jgi:hypothetical protein
MSGTWDVEMTLEGTLNGAPFTTLAWTGFAETGNYDDKTKQFELKADYPLAGDTWHQRTVIQQTSADAMTAASYLSFGAVPEWKAVEIKYTGKR